MQTLRATRSSLPVRRLRVGATVRERSNGDQRRCSPAGGGMTPLAFFAAPFSQTRKSIDLERKEKASPCPRRQHPPAHALSPSHARGSRTSTEPFRRGSVRSGARSSGAQNRTALLRHHRRNGQLAIVARPLAAPWVFSHPLSGALSLSPSPSSHQTRYPLQVRASAEQPKAVAAAVPRVKQALAAAALALAVGVTAMPAFADVSGLTPCSQSKPYAARQKKEVKALQKRLKQVRKETGTEGRAKRNASAE